MNWESNLGLLLSRLCIKQRSLGCFGRRGCNNIIQDHEKGLIASNILKLSVLEDEVKLAFQALSSQKIAAIDGIGRNKASKRNSNKKGPKQNISSDVENNTDQKGPKKSPKKRELTQCVDYHAIS